MGPGAVAGDPGVWMGRFEDKVAVVTGWGGGIGGEGYAKRLAAEGARVVVADLNQAGAERVAKEINDEGGEALATVLDIGDDESPAVMAQATVDAFGGIDYLVNNAAIYGGRATRRSSRSSSRTISTS